MEELKTSGNVSHTEELGLVPSASQYAPQSYASTLAPVQGEYSQDSLLKLILTPIGTLANPAAVWAVVTLSFPVLWLVGLILVIASIFSVPPYNLNPTQLGYMWAGRKFFTPPSRPWYVANYLSSAAIVIGFLACVVAGPASDWSAKYLSRRNHGKYEPEFRLFIAIGMAACCGLGYYLFGYLISKQGSIISISIVFGLCLVSESNPTIIMQRLH